MDINYQDQDYTRKITFLKLQELSDTISEIQEDLQQINESLLNLIIAMNNKVDGNPEITPDEHPVITYDAKGLVTEGRDLTTLDMPADLITEINGKIPFSDIKTSFEDDDLDKPASAYLTHRLQDEKVSVGQLTTNITFYPTTATSSIAGYNWLVSVTTDTDYDTTSVDVRVPETGALLTTSNDDGVLGTQLVGSLISKGGHFEGNPDVFHISVVGNIQKITGGENDNARFYFKVYETPDDGTTQNHLGTSNKTPLVQTYPSPYSYEEFGVNTLIPSFDFTNDSRFIFKFYADTTETNDIAVYQFQFGGIQPVKALLPVPASVISTNLSSQDIEDMYNSEVIQVTTDEKNTRTEIQVRRFSPQDVADMDTIMQATDYDESGNANNYNLTLVADGSQPTGFRVIAKAGLDDVTVDNVVLTDYILTLNLTNGASWDIDMLNLLLKYASETQPNLQSSLAGYENYNATFFLQDELQDYNWKGVGINGATITIVKNVTSLRSSGSLKLIGNQNRINAMPITFVIDTDKWYRGETQIMHPSTNTGGGGRHYMILNQFDYEGLTISAHMVVWFQNTTTYLARDLEVTDNIIYMKQGATPFTDYSASYARRISFWRKQVDQSFRYQGAQGEGKIYDEQGYTRDTTISSIWPYNVGAIDTYEVSQADVDTGKWDNDIVAGTIVNRITSDTTIAANLFAGGWEVGFKAGDMVAQGSSGSTYKYMYAGKAVIADDLWHDINGQWFKGQDISGLGTISQIINGIPTLIWNGTATVSIGGLYNFRTYAGASFHMSDIGYFGVWGIKAKSNEDYFLKNPPTNETTAQTQGSPIWIDSNNFIKKTT